MTARHWTIPLLLAWPGAHAPAASYWSDALPGSSAWSHQDNWPARSSHRPPQPSDSTCLASPPH